MSQTLLASEVKTCQPSSNCRHTALAIGQRPDQRPGPTPTPTPSPPSTTTATCVTQNQSEFHTEWSDGNVHAAGFTTAWPPNKAVMGSSAYQGIDLDLNGRNEEDGGPTFAAITRRSYHPGGVNALFGDGSVKFVKSRSTGSPGGPWGRSPEARWSARTSTDRLWDRRAVHGCRLALRVRMSPRDDAEELPQVR